MEIDDITALILTYNEAANLRQTLERLQWAKSILIVDSGSTDETIRIANEFPSVRVIEHPFDHFADQCNFGLSHINSLWTLSLDADYKCSADLEREISGLDGSDMGYRAEFRYCISGKPLRGTLYPSRIVLYRTTMANYERDGHAHRVRIGGPIGQLQSRILHDDRKPLSVWINSQAHYARLEADKLTSMPVHLLSWKDRLRTKIVFAPLLTLVYCLFWKGLILDGWAGVFYTLQRVYAELLLALMLLEKRFAR